jgi:SHS2 domain-containing protein
LPELFAHAAWAMFDLMSDATLIQPRQTIHVSVAGNDIEDMLVRWLSELLYLYDTQRFLYCAAAFTTLEPTRVTATVHGESFDATRHPIDTEIKAVTYHQLAITPAAGGWQAQVIFDL